MATPLEELMRELVFDSAPRPAVTIGATPGADSRMAAVAGAGPAPGSPAPVGAVAATELARAAQDSLSLLALSSAPWVGVRIY